MIEPLSLQSPESGEIVYHFVGQVELIGLPGRRPGPNSSGRERTSNERCLN